MDHVRELQGRIFAVAVAFMLVAGIGFLTQTLQQQLSRQGGASRSISSGYGYGASVYGGRR